MNWISQSLAFIVVLFQIIGIYCDSPPSPVFYAHDGDTYLMLFSALYPLHDTTDYGDRSGIFTNYPQLQPDAHILDAVRGVIPKLEREAKHLWYGFTNAVYNDSMAYPELIMDVTPSAVWDKFALDCNESNVGANGTIVDAMLENNILFAGKTESVLHRIEYDYDKKKVIMHICKITVNSTNHVSDVQSKQIKVTFNNFRFQHFKDHDITTLLVTMAPLYNLNDSYWNGYGVPDPAYGALLPSVLRKQMINPEDFVYGDGIPFVVSTYMAPKLLKLHFNVVDLEAIGKANKKVFRHYHEICQNSAHYAGDYEAALHYHDYSDILYERDSAWHDTWDHKYLPDDFFGLYDLSDALYYASESLTDDMINATYVMAANDHSEHIWYGHHQCAVTNCADRRITPGCNQPACQAHVCTYDPFCCNTNWDWQCVDEAGNDDNCTCVHGNGHRMEHRNATEIDQFDDIGEYAICLDYYASSEYVDGFEDLTIEYCRGLPQSDEVKRCLHRIIRECEDGNAYQKVIGERNEALAMLRGLSVALQTLDHVMPGHDIATRLSQWIANN